ncbi:MAG: M6 family metalloprotease domain-containing protein [Alistipes sp.]|nr:M6 family metalloprotease domain-containing protein [Candidatus Alistipes equi]
MKKILLIILSALACIVASHAVPALNKPITVTQPDGTVLTIRMHGDEYLHWATCGNSLVVKSSDGYWHYATFDEQGVSYIQGGRVTVNLQGDGKSVVPPREAIAKAQQKRNQNYISKKNLVPKTSSRYSPISEGNKRFLILLIEFSDKKFSKKKSDFENMLNGEAYTYNGATGSVKRYYTDVSFGKFNPQFDVYGPISVSYTSAYCANDPLNAVIQACRYAHDNLGVNFANYCNMSSSAVDNVFFFFPGYNQAEGGGSDTIWPHAAEYGNAFLVLDGKSIHCYGCASEFKANAGAVMAGIGTFSHEFGHVIGLPDFYDTDYEENGQCFALGTLSLMSDGSYNNNGNTPPYFTYEEKHILGWDNGLTLLKDGTNVLSKTSDNVTFYNPTTTKNEYYLYESRPNIGWDKYTSCAGMAIYHVDKSDYVMPNGYTAGMLWEMGYYINDFANHQCMDLVESVYPESALQYYSDMVFPGRKNVTKFTSDTKPAARSWAGKNTGYNITNISFNSTFGTTTLTVSTEKMITGTVRNSLGEPLPQVKVLIKYITSSPEIKSIITHNGVSLSQLNLTPSADSEEYVSTTDANGNFEVKLTRAGKYTVSINHGEYQPYNSSVTVDSVSNIDIVLTTVQDEANVNLQKYKSISGNLVGYGDNTDHYGAMRYTAKELESYVDFPIKSISFLVDNGGNGTVDKMGVQIYFDNVLQCDCESKHIFGTMCTVDISAYNLKIPANKTVTFAYYLLNPSYGYPFRLADPETPATGGNLVTNNPNSGWVSISNGNVVISAKIIDNEKIIDLSGINYILLENSYKSGDTLQLKLKTSSINTPSNISWTVNGKPASKSVVLEKGVCIIRAYLTFASGRHEVIETKLNVK